MGGIVSARPQEKYGAEEPNTRSMNGQRRPEIPFSPEPIGQGDTAEQFTIRDNYYGADSRERTLLDLKPRSEPRKIVKWQLGQLIGKGAFGSVYLGMNQENGALMAVKQIVIDLDAPEELTTFEYEISLMQNLHHRNTVRYLGYDRTDTTLNIFMEYVSGGSISSLISKFGPFPEAVIRVYTLQLLQGLMYLHDHQIIHRDIKGANLLVDNQAVVKLADFGSSKKLRTIAIEANDQGRHSLKGTPYFLAPEVISGQTVGRQSDIWSVGCVIPTTLVLLASGHRVQAGELSVGDQLLGPDARPREIVRLQEGDDAPLFKITTYHTIRTSNRANIDVNIDSDTVDVTEDHVLTLVFRKFACWQPFPSDGYKEHRVERGKDGVLRLRLLTVHALPDPAVHGSLDRCFTTCDMNVRDFLSMSKTDQAHFFMAVNRAPLQGPAVVTVDLPAVNSIQNSTLSQEIIVLTPGLAWLIGFWLGDGTSSKPYEFSMGHTELDGTVDEYEEVTRFRQLLHFWEGESGLEALFGKLTGRPEYRKFQFPKNDLWCRLLTVLGVLVLQRDGEREKDFLSDSIAAHSSSKALPESLALALGNHENRLSFVAGFMDANGHIGIAAAGTPQAVKFPVINLAQEESRHFRDGFYSLAVLLGLDSSSKRGYHRETRMEYVCYSNNPRVIADITRRSVFRKGLKSDPASIRTGVVEDTHFRVPLSLEDDTECVSIPCPTVPRKCMPIKSLRFAGRRFKIEPTNNRGPWIGIGLPEGTDKRHVLADGTTHHNCCVIEMATGKPPYHQFSTQVAVLYQIAMDKSIPELPEWLSPNGLHFLRRCLCRNPDKRPTAAQLLQHPWMQGVELPFSPEPTPRAPAAREDSQMAPQLPATQFNFGGEAQQVADDNESTDSDSELTDNGVSGSLVDCNTGTFSHVNPMMEPSFKCDVHVQFDAVTSPGVTEAGFAASPATFGAGEPELVRELTAEFGQRFDATEE